MKINRDNVKWAARLISIVFLVVVADALVALFMRRPFPLTAIIPCTLPILIAVFVILPMTRAQKS